MKEWKKWDDGGQLESPACEEKGNSKWEREEERGRNCTLYTHLLYDLWLKQLRSSYGESRVIDNCLYHLPPPPSIRTADQWEISFRPFFFIRWSFKWWIVNGQGPQWHRNNDNCDKGKGARERTSISTCPFSHFVSLDRDWEREEKWPQTCLSNDQTTSLPSSLLPHHLSSTSKEMSNFIWLFIAKRHRLINRM